MARDTELAVCFVDVCESTSLFEEHGDDRAWEIVGRALRRVSEVIEQHEGTVVKSLGDGLMGTFPELSAAAHAVMQFPKVVREDETLADLGIEVRGGLCHGSVVQEESGDVFGDAVNTASRLTDWAHAGQAVTTAETMSALPDSFQEYARPLGDKTLRGKTETVEIVELLREQSESTLTVVDRRAPSFDQETKAVLLLRYGGETRTVRQDPLWLGRGTVNDLQVEDPRVSRKHAYVERQSGSFQVVDRSTNGTYVRVGEEVTFLHHEQLRLHGSGQISLGRPIEAEDAELLRFECRRDSSEEASP